MREWLTIAAWGAGGVGALLALIIAITYVPAVMVKARAKRLLRANARGKLALTYDDGPGPLLTPALLDLLARYNAKASFYLVGFRAQRFPEVCKMLADSGHELGCHTQTHRHPWKLLPWTAVRDVNNGYQSLSPWIGADAPFRPPFGKMTTWTWLAARRRKARLNWWTFDGCDTYETLPQPQAVGDALLKAGGGVVLMHSHDRGQDRQNYVLALTEVLLQLARQHGLQLCTVSQLLDPNPPNPNEVEGRRACMA